MRGIRTRTTLADGRELLYYDEREGVDSSRPDRRELAPVSTGLEIRYDPLLDEWIIVASHRQARTFLPPSTECPLDPSSPDRLTEIPADDCVQMSMPYIACWQQAPVRAAEDARKLFRLHAQVFTIRRAPDKLNFLAGSESGAGVFTNDIGPERAAEMLRNAG